MGKFDSFTKYTAMVRLAQDAKVFDRKSGDGVDVVLTFVDSSRIDGTEDLWVDARVAKFQAERAMKYKKGDEVLVEGKLRFKKQDDGGLRGKVYDAIVQSFVKLSERTSDAPPPEDKPATTGTPVFE